MDGGERTASAAIHFLVAAEQPTSELLRLRSDEVFHQDDRRKGHRGWDTARLGLDLSQGDRRKGHR